MNQNTNMHACSVAQSRLTLHNPMDCSTPGFPVLHHLLELNLMSTESMMPSNHLTLCRPFSSCPQSFKTLLSDKVKYATLKTHLPPPPRPRNRQGPNTPSHLSSTGQTSHSSERRGFYRELLLFCPSKEH